MGNSEKSTTKPMSAEGEKKYLQIQVNATGIIINDNDKMIVVDNTQVVYESQPFELSKTVGTYIFEYSENGKIECRKDTENGIVYQGDKDGKIHMYSNEQEK